MESKPNEPVAACSAFSKILGTGILACILCSVLLIGIAWPVGKVMNVSNAVIWMISHWWIAFLVGAVAIGLRGSIAKLPFGASLVTYLLPAVSLMGLVGACLAIYPDAGFRTDLFATVPLILIFYVFGYLWMKFAPKATLKTAQLRAAIPPILGGVVVLCLAAVPVFRSNNFVYRNAFELSLKKSTIANGVMVTEAILEVRKPGSYDFTAPRYSPFTGEEDSDVDASLEFGKITWGASGAPKNGESGTYPLQIRWEKNIPTPELQMQYAGYYDDMMYLEVRDASKEPRTLIYHIPAKMPSSQAVDKAKES